MGEVSRSWVAGQWEPPWSAGVGGSGVQASRGQVLRGHESQALELASFPRPVESRGRVLSRKRTGLGLRVPIAAQWGQIGGEESRKEVGQDSPWRSQPWT